MGKSTEITDMVLQQQPENEFCNLTDTLTNNLNNINNNKINKDRSHDVDEHLMAVDDEIQQQQQRESNALVLNDDNNNSNDNFNNPDLGPETDVDAIEDDDDFQFHTGSTAIAAGGDKEKTQMEFKETDDVTDRVEMSFTSGVDLINTENTMFGNVLENKVFEGLSLHNPDLMGASNPFSDKSAATIEFMDNFVENTDNKLIEEQIEEMQQEEFKQEHGANDFIENIAEREIDFVSHDESMAAPAETNAFELDQELLISANNEVNEQEEEEEVAIQQQKPQVSGELENFYSLKRFYEGNFFSSIHEIFLHSG